MKQTIVNFIGSLMILIGLVGISTAQQTVSGKLISDEGEELVGATVMVKGTARGTITNINGDYSIEANNGDVIVYSYIGLITTEQEVNGNLLNATLKTDATTLSDIVVTATRQPIRKIQTTTSITTIGSEELANIQPESVAEALSYTPGVTVENSQGRKSNYNIRGFPSGNTYVTTLLDGLPLNGFSARSAGVNEFLALDNNTERVEVVRGSGATLFGRAAGAGAVNLVSRSGGDEFEGSVSFTRFNNVVNEGHPFEGDFDYRVDFNVNGPLEGGIKYSIGGYIMEDSGFKEWATKDQGGQISANIEFPVSDAIDLKVYGIISNNQFNNLTDVPFDLGTREIAEGWDNSNSFYPDNSQLNFTSELRTSTFAPIQFTAPLLDSNGNTITQNQVSDNREDVDGGLAGLSAEIRLSDNVTLFEKIRVSSYDWRDHNEISLTTFYNFDSNILRLNANSIGDISDLINETRLQIEAGSDRAKHLFSLGFYLSRAEYDRFGGLHFYTSNVDPRPTYGFFGPPGTPPPTRFQLSTTTSHQEENVVGLYVGDEMVFNEKLSVNVGIRWDRMTGFFNNDPEEIDGLDFNPAELEENELNFSNFSGSIGANYLISPRTAVYGSFVRAFSLPSVGLNTPIPEDDEIVWNSEIGFRFGIGGLGVDLGLFNTIINNRVAVVFDPMAANGQTFIPLPIGDNSVRGGELQLTYAPQAIKGLLLRGSITVQDSEYRRDSEGNSFGITLDRIDDDGDPDTPTVIQADLDNLFGLNVITDERTGDPVIDVAGNRVQNTPNLIYSFIVGYNSNSFGISYDMVQYRGRFATALNLYETPDLTVANANAYYRFGFNNGTGLRLGIRIKNLFDSNGAQQLVLGSTNDSVLIQRQATPDFDGVLGFGIVQIPRRVLLTLGFDF